MQNAVQLKDVEFAWAKQQSPFLNIPELRILVGEKVFIQGSSGSGKTTLLSLLGGVLTPQKGTVEVLGETINKLGSARRDAFRVDHIGFVFQMFNLLPFLSVLDNVLLPCRFSKRRKKRALMSADTLPKAANQLLTALELSAALQQKSVAELSVGQQQRVAVARALIGAPELLIADEPTSALDTESQSAFLELLFQECATNQTTLIFVSHDHSLSRHFDRVLPIQNLFESN